MPGGWQYATVCSSNMNRSMEAHYQMLKMGLDVRSFGTGTNVRLPGPSQDKPNVYEFGTPYSYILQDLSKKNLHLYTQTGLIKMLERNDSEIFHNSGKLCPERWYDMDAKLKLDVVLTYEARVFDAVLQDLQGNDKNTFSGVHVINIETKDNHDEAVVSGKITCELCRKLEGLTDIENDIVAALDDFQEQTKRPLVYTLVYT